MLITTCLLVIAIGGLIESLLQNAKSHRYRMRLTAGTSLHNKKEYWE